LYRALGLPEPVFGHVPLILGTDGKRLSKRHGATAVGDYRAQGILPEAMVNFLALLGWSPGDDREVMTLDELIEAFDPSRILKKSAVFDPDKLSWLNGRHLAGKPNAELRSRVKEHLGDLPPGDLERLDDARWGDELMEIIKNRARDLDALAGEARPFVCTELVYDTAAVDKHWLKDPDAATERLTRVAAAFEGAAWTREELESRLRGLAEEMGVGAGKLIHPLRVALTGNMASPGIFDVLVVLGPERVSQRVREALRRIGAP
jgi:glutamyl-tRNA synthetase